MKSFKYIAISLLIALIGLTTASSVMAQPGYYNSPPPGYAPPQQYIPPPAFNQAYRPPYYGNRGYGNRGYGNRGYGNRGYGNRGYGNRGYGNRNYGNSGFGRNMPFNRFNNTPWNRFSNGSGWGNNNNYGPDTDWFTDTPRRWMRNGPKEGAGQVFDDFLDGPSRMGDMPGGWSAPTISVPNPIDVADELERGSQDMFNND
jgi:hypothetical protein